MTFHEMFLNRPKMLTSKEASEYLGLKTGTLEIWRRTKRYNLPYSKIGRLVRYKKSDLDDFIERRTVVNKYGD
jgi:excisionase family DNA binding protein